MPPYTLPGNKTQSGIKSRSSKTGTPDNFNEFRFEDKKGEEQVYLHAEKNYDIVVENNETHSVGADRTKTVSGNETAHVKKQRNHSVDKAEIISIGENQNISVGTTYTLEVKDQITLKCGASTITMNSGGEITIDGVVVTVNGSSKIDLNP
jgi:type VI secretion system secreted protein VgrG